MSDRKPGHMDVHFVVGEHEAHALMRAKRFAESGSAAGMPDGDIVGPDRNPRPAPAPSCRSRSAFRPSRAVRGTAFSARGPRPLRGGGCCLRPGQRSEAQSARALSSPRPRTQPPFRNETWKGKRPAVFALPFSFSRRSSVGPCDVHRGSCSCGMMSSRTKVPMRAESV